MNDVHPEDVLVLRLNFHLYLVMAACVEMRC